MNTDPLIDEVRQARHRISEECQHDIWKLYARYNAVQEEMKSRGKARFITSPLVAGTESDAPTEVLDEK